jgi:agarase
LERWFAPETAVAAHGEPQTFKIKITQAETVKSAKLIIGLHRRGGVTEPLGVSMNGTPINVDAGDADEFSEFFAPLDARVLTEILRASNQFVIKAQNSATITSVQLITQRVVE